MTQETIWDIPEPLSTHDVRVDDDTVIRLRRHGNPEGPRLVLSHGNGLAIDLYYPFWSLLTDDFDLIMYDLRNHGWNTVGSLEEHSIPIMVRDHDKILEAIDYHYGEKPKVGVFHSVSAMVSLLSPTKGSGYSARVLFDPPLCKPGRSLRAFEEATGRLAEAARRRTSRFRTRKQLVDVLPFVPTFQKMVPGVFDLFAETTLREHPGEEGYELCCPPEYEAKIMEYSGIYAPLVDFDVLLSPTKVIGADPTVPYSYLPTLDFGEFFTVDYDFLPEATHFLPLERPEECVAVMLEFVEPIMFPDPTHLQ